MRRRSHWISWIRTNADLEEREDTAQETAQDAAPDKAQNAEQDEAKELAENLQKVRDNLAESCKKAGRKPEDVRLIGVTKFHPVEVCREARDLGLLDLGENRVQEFSAKYAALEGESPAIRWHLIGHLQRNKVKDVIGRTELIHSVDSQRLLKEINKRARKADIVQDVLLQVNYTGEPQKHGFSEEGLFEALEDFGEKYENINVRGLMTMAEYGASEERLRETFSGVRDLLPKVRAKLPDEIAEQVELSSE